MKRAQVRRVRVLRKLRRERQHLVQRPNHRKTAKALGIKVPLYLVIAAFQVAEQSGQPANRDHIERLILEAAARVMGLQIQVLRAIFDGYIMTVDIAVWQLRRQAA
jgi:hypothetical protein